MKRHLLIVADDFGYGVARNRGIFKCFQQHAISAISILANCKHSNDAVALVKELDIPVGLHFNVTQGYPLSDPLFVSSLVSSDGKFMGKNTFHHAKIVPCHFLHELQAQLDWFEKAFGKAPEHVDGHQHVHVHPDIARIFAIMLSQRGIRRTRVPYEDEASEEPQNMSVTRQKFHAYIRSISQNALSIFKEFGLVQTDGFLGLNLVGSDMSIERLQQTLKNFFGRGLSSCELMVHPGYVCDKYSDGFTGEQESDLFSRSPDREHELSVLTSPDMLQFYKDENISLVGTFPITMVKPSR